MTKVEILAEQIKKALAAFHEETTIVDNKSIGGKRFEFYVDDIGEGEKEFFYSVDGEKKVSLGRDETDAKRKWDDLGADDGKKEADEFERLDARDLPESGLFELWKSADGYFYSIDGENKVFLSKDEAEAVKEFEDLFALASVPMRALEAENPVTLDQISKALKEQVPSADIKGVTDAPGGAEGFLVYWDEDDDTGDSSNSAAVSSVMSGFGYSGQQDRSGEEGPAVVFYKS